MKTTRRFRTRYAPSPTGHLHLGNARTALFSYLLAKHYKGDYIIRIEDTDTNRNTKEGVQSQLSYLEWLGITHDEGPFKEVEKYAPYFQSKRKKLYRKYLNNLIEKKLAYPCFCTPEELEKQREEQVQQGRKAPMYDRRCLALSKETIEKLKKTITPTYRFKVPQGNTICWLDLVRDKISFERDNIEDFIIMKKNGLPTYNFANVVDDIEMEISHIVRGEEHISNTPKQILLYEAFEKTSPKFGHLPIILNTKGKKLSKRDTELMQFISDYKEAGLFPEAIINYLSLLGWSPKEEKEVFSKGELVKMFDFDRISKAPAHYDITKLFWFNKEYINKLSEEEKNQRREELFPSNTKLNIILDSKKLSLDNFISRIIDINEWTLTDHKKVVEEVKNYIASATKNKNSLDWLNYIEEKLNSLLTLKGNDIVFNDSLERVRDQIKDILNETKSKFNVGGKEFFQTLRKRFSNREKGPEMWRVLFIYSALSKAHE